MGAKTRVTAEMYNKLKKELKSAKDDKKVMKKYNLGQTTVRAIRNTSSYTAFRERTVLRKYKKHNEAQASELQKINRKADIAVEVFAWICVAGLAALGAIVVMTIIKAING